MCLKLKLHRLYGVEDLDKESTKDEIRSGYELLYAGFL